MPGVEAEVDVRVGQQPVHLVLKLHERSRVRVERDAQSRGCGDLGDDDGRSHQVLPPAFVESCGDVAAACRPHAARVEAVDEDQHGAAGGGHEVDCLLGDGYGDGSVAGEGSMTKHAAISSAMRCHGGSVGWGGGSMPQVPGDGRDLHRRS